MNELIELSATRIYFRDRSNGVIALWSVRGISPGWFPTRALAEAAALATFPAESATERYYRLHEVRFCEESL